MSLLNNMLNDLEKRQATTGVNRSLSGGALHSPPARRGNYGPMLLLALVAVAAAVLAWIIYKKPGSQPPATQVAAANSLPQTHPVSAKPTPAIENGSSPSPLAPMVQAAPEVVSRPSEPPATTRQTAKPEVAAARKSSVSTSTATSTHQDNAKVAETQSATKPAMVTMASDKATKDSAEVFEQDRPAPKQLVTHASSFKIVRPQQQSDNLYRQAISLMQQSKSTEAQHALRQAVEINSANHNARQLLAELLVDAGSHAEASALLREGLDISPGHTGFSMALARLQVMNGAKGDAISTLEQGLASAGDDAEYHAFLAALLQ